MALVSLPPLISALFDFIGNRFTKAINYYEVFKNKIAIKYQGFKAKHPLYSRIADTLSKGINFVFQFLVSPKVWRSMILILASTGFALSTMGVGPIIVFSLTLVGFFATVYSEVNQKINILKLQREEKALKNLVIQKQRAVNLAKDIGILSPELAEKLGFKTLSQRKTGYVKVPENTKELRRISASLLNIRDLKTELASTDRQKERERYKALHDKIIEAKKVAQQKNELGYTTVGKAAMKAAAYGFVSAVTSLGVLAFATSPYTIALGASSVMSNYIGSGMTIYSESNLKQALKNAVSVFRLRPDIPEYKSVNDIEEQSRLAKLERKVLIKLENDKRYKDIVRLIRDEGGSQDLYNEAAKIKEKVERDILIQSILIKQDQRLLMIDKEIESKVNRLKYIKIREIYKDHKERKILQNQAAKLVLKTKLVLALGDNKMNRSDTMDILKVIYGIEDYRDLKEFYTNPLVAKHKDQISKIFEHLQTRQEIALKTHEVIELSARTKAKTIIMSSQVSHSEKTYAQVRDEVVASEFSNFDTNRSITSYGLLSKYSSQDHTSYGKMFLSSLRRIFDFTKPTISITSNPHDLLLDSKLRDFATLSAEDEKVKESYKERVSAVPNIIREAINLDTTMKSVVPILTLLAIDSGHVTSADNKMTEILKVLISPQTSFKGSQVISGDTLSPAINNPSDNSGIFHVTYYLLFARMGQLFGALISYAVNAYRDWKEGKKDFIKHDKSKRIALSSTAIKLSSSIEIPILGYDTVEVHQDDVAVERGEQIPAKPKPISLPVVKHKLRNPDQIATKKKSPRATETSALSSPSIKDKPPRNVKSRYKDRRPRKVDTNVPARFRQG